MVGVVGVVVVVGEESFREKFFECCFFLQERERGDIMILCLKDTRYGWTGTDRAAQIYIEKKYCVEHPVDGGYM